MCVSLKVNIKLALAPPYPQFFLKIKLLKFIEETWFVLFLKIIFSSTLDLLDLEVMLKYIKQYSPISPKLEDRINGIGTFPGVWDQSVAFSNSEINCAELIVLKIVLVSIPSCLTILFPTSVF